MWARMLTIRVTRGLLVTIRNLRIWDRQAEVWKNFTSPITPSKYVLFFKSFTAKKGCMYITSSFPLLVLGSMFITTRKQRLIRQSVMKGDFSPRPFFFFPNFKQNFIRSKNTFFEDWNFRQKTLPSSAN